VLVLGSGSAIHYDYNNGSTTNQNNYSAKPSSFNAYAAEFSWWKSKIYGHIIGYIREITHIAYVLRF